MDLIQIIIELIVKAMSGPKTSLPPGTRPDEVVRQMQARIEAARRQDAQAQATARTGFRPNKGQLAPQLRKATPLFKQRKTKRKMPPALPPAVVVQPAAKVTAAPPAAVAAPPKAAPIYVDAKVLARWLRPQTLRSQFVLTEILQPPVALRESHLL